MWFTSVELAGLLALGEWDWGESTAPPRMLATADDATLNGDGFAGDWDDVSPLHVLLLVMRKPTSLLKHFSMV